MNRRKFLHSVVAGGAAGIGLTKAGLSLAEQKAKESRIITYEVRGFTCVTCATGLEVTLLREKGVTRASATYPEGRVVIGFDESLVAENAIRTIITDCGFTVS
jgi:copper chaperone CopZ